MVPLASWADSGLLLSVPTADGAASSSQLLKPADKSPSGWSAPGGSDSVELHIVLPRQSNVGQVCLEPGCPYTAGFDLPQIAVAIGSSLDGLETVPVQVLASPSLLSLALSVVSLLLCCLSPSLVPWPLSLPVVSLPVIL